MYDIDPVTFEKIVAPVLVFIITGLLGWIATMIKKADRDRRELAEQERAARTQREAEQDNDMKNIMAALRASLHNSLKQETERIIKQGYRSMDDSRNLQYMFEPYCAIKGNSIIEDLYSHAMAMPIKESKERSKHEESGAY